MSKSAILTADRPAYHSGMLIVKVRPTASDSVGFNSILEKSSHSLTTPGIAALAMYERGGLIKRITPLRPNPPENPDLYFGGHLAKLASSLETAQPDENNAGVNIIELEQENDTDNLHRALIADAHIEAVSRVPVRYFLVDTRPKTRRKSSGKSRAIEAEELLDSDLLAKAAPPPATTMWNLRTIKWAEARKTQGFPDAQNVSVAVLDSGVETDHPDLSGRINNYVFSYPEASAPSGAKDIVGHGTHVAGTIGALINNDLGINGICACDLRVWKIFSDQVSSTAHRGVFRYIVDPIMYRLALQQCLDQRVQILNLSIGGTGSADFDEANKINQLIANGTIVVAAMGNDREFQSPLSFPAAIPGVIAVGATTLNDTVADFSNRGNHITLCAPGVGIWSTLPTYPGQTGFEAVIGSDGAAGLGQPKRREMNYDDWKGTSMAAPHVSAAIALLIAKHGKLSRNEIIEKIKQTVDKLPAMQGLPFHPDFGFGRLNLLRLLV